MNAANTKIKFYTLGSEKIDFKSAQLDASKPILLSSKYNRALQSVIDKDISSLVDKFDSMKEKIRKLLVIHNITEKLENNTVENVEKVLNSLNNIIDIIKHEKEQIKLGLFSTNKKEKKEKIKSLEKCLSSLLKYQAEIISIKNEYNKLIQRRGILINIVEQEELNESKKYDPLERTINFYLSKKEN